MTTDKPVAIVTGGSRGIGAAIVRQLASANYTVAALSRKGMGIEEDDTGTGDIRGVACDVSSGSALAQAFATCASMGQIAAVVNNAGIWIGARSSELDDADYDAVMNTNAKGCFMACRAAYPYLRDAGGGCIVNIGSFYDKLGVPGGLAYCASKAAVGAITRCLAVEWAKDSIRVIDVAPGFIETDLNAQLPEKVRDSIRSRIPSGRFGASEEVGKLVRSLIVDDISYLTGETIYIDGAQSLKE